MNKLTFAWVASTLSLLALGLSVASLALVGIKARQNVCQAVDTVNSSIRVVLERGIAQGESELKDQKFKQFWPEIRQAIAQNRYWEQKLFQNRVC